MKHKRRRPRPTNRELGEKLASMLEHVAGLCRKAAAGHEPSQEELYYKYWDRGQFGNPNHPTYGLMVGGGGLAGAVIFPDAHEVPVEAN